jgi:acyl-CoA thioesterase I
LYHGPRKSKTPPGPAFLPALALVFALVLGAFVSPAPARAASARPVHLTAFGDSLTAGYGLRPEQAFPACLERLLRAEGFEVAIDNAGVSGDTTAMGLDRLDWSIPGTPDGVILELGANDGLRGLPVATIESNLEAMVILLKARGIPVMLCGMKALLNMGKDYGREYAAVFERVAKKHGLVFYPFFLEGVAGRGELNQGDAIHPNPAGTEEVARRILPTAKEFLRRIEGKQTP